MDIPVEIFHEILSHLPVIDINRVENALDIDIPEYLYLRIHKAKFKSSLNEINCIVCEYNSVSDGYNLAIRIIDEKNWYCIYVYYHKAQTYTHNKFKTGREGSNVFTVYSPKLSESFTECISSTRMELFTIRKQEYNPAIFLMPKGNKSTFGIGGNHEFIDSSYCVVIVENSIY